jgi:hypothetical protein
MRISPLILPLVGIGLFTPRPSRADGENAPPPTGYAWCALEPLGGRVLIPAGWFCRKITVQNGTGFQITKEEVASKGADPLAAYANKRPYWDIDLASKRVDYRTGFTIEVISGPFWNKSRLSKLADGIFEDRKREGRMSALLDSSIGTYSARSFNREGMESVGNVIESQQFVELILQDTGTPTMVLVTFDCPLSAWPQDKELCERFFATLSLFQGADEADHSPYPMPAGPPPRSAKAGDH